MNQDMSIKKNLDIQLYEMFCQEIIQGHWVQGQIINADNLAEAFGVSRTPVVHALKRMLANEMICVTKTGHYYVPTFTEKQVCDLVGVRALLEREAITEMERNSIKIDFDTLRRLSQDCLTYNQEEEQIKTRQTDLDLHSFLVGQSGNQCLSNLFAKVQGQFIVANYLLTTHTKEQQEVAADDHIRLLDALEAGDYDRARAISDEHIYSARDKILAKMRYNQHSA